MPDSLNHLASQVRDDPFFLAGLLAEFSASERLDDAGLALYLGCRVEDLSCLKLCRAPAETPADFRADIAAIATHFGLDPSRLTAAVRQGRVIRAQRQAGDMLLAAREREGGPP